MLGQTILKSEEAQLHMASVLIVGRSQRHICFMSALDAGLHQTRCHSSVTTAVRSLERDVPDLVILAETVHPLAQAFFVRQLRDLTPAVKVIAIHAGDTDLGSADACTERLDGSFDLGADTASLLATVDAILLSSAQSSYDDIEHVN
jgi:hypothetical protein